MDNYSFSVAWSEADGEYAATSAEFPGLSGLAPSAEDAVRELRAAMEVAVEAFRQDGEPIPAPHLLKGFSGQFRLRLPRSQHAALVARAAAEGVSINSLVQSYIAAGLASDQVAQHAAEKLENALAQVVSQIAEAIR